MYLAPFHQYKHRGHFSQTAQVKVKTSKSLPHGYINGKDADRFYTETAWGVWLNNLVNTKSGPALSFYADSQIGFWRRNSSQTGVSDEHHFTLSKVNLPNVSAAGWWKKTATATLFDISSVAVVRCHAGAASWVYNKRQQFSWYAEGIFTSILVDWSVI